MAGPSDGAPALVVVDMQAGLTAGPPKHDLAGVVRRINELAAAMRAAGGHVVWIRHCGEAGSGFARDEAGWAFLPDLDVRPGDPVAEKTLNDPFAGTDLQERLAALGVGRLIVTGWATDFCVSATVRAAVGRGYRTAVASDGHTLNDRTEIDAPTAIAYHNWIWSELLAREPVDVRPAAALAEALARGG